MQARDHLHFFLRDSENMPEESFGFAWQECRNVCEGKAGYVKFHKSAVCLNSW